MANSSKGHWDGHTDPGSQEVRCLRATSCQRPPCVPRAACHRAAAHSFLPGPTGMNIHPNPPPQARAPQALLRRLAGSGRGSSFSQSPSSCNAALHHDDHDHHVLPGQCPTGLLMDGLPVSFVVHVPRLLQHTVAAGIVATDAWPRMQASRLVVPS